MTMMTMSKPTHGQAIVQDHDARNIHDVYRIYRKVQDAVVSGNTTTVRDNVTSRDAATPNSSSSSAGVVTYRPITSREIEILRGPTCRCTCTDWSKVYIRVLADAVVGQQQQQHCCDFSDLFQTHLSDNHFDGIVVFDLTEDKTKSPTYPSSTSINSWMRLPPGIHSNTFIADSILHLRSCRVYRNAFVSHTFVAPYAVLMNCGHVSATNDTSASPVVAAAAARGRIDIVVGPESGGGRPLDLTIDSTMIDVGKFLRFDKSASNTTPQTIPDNCNFATAIPHSQNFNVLLSQTVIRDTPTIQYVCLQPSSTIVGACSVKNAMLQAGAKISNSCIVSNVLMQWDATISDNSNVDTVLMMEHSHCGPASIIHSSVLGPDCHVSAGEIHASVFGPNTNAHHQSLIIGVLWPLGRGNVGYGANVGSNHTGRSADQEAVAGEGIFWGLGTIIKFPVDLSFAPYSIVAAGTQLGQQRICMPFSLIMKHDANDNENIIVPGWVLQSTPFTLARNEQKFRSRRKAKRHYHYTGWEIFRPSIIEMCRHSMRVLEDVKRTGLSKGVAGIGNCKLTETACDKGIEAYKDCIHRYLLQGLLTWVILVTSDDENGFVDVAIKHEFVDEVTEKIDNATSRQPVDYSSSVQWPSFPWDDDDMNQNEWNYQRELILDEFPLEDRSKPLSWLKDLLKKLVKLEKDYALRVATCKRRDDVRGKAIIPGYSDSHVEADDDEVVLAVQKKAESNEVFVEHLLVKLQDKE